MAADWTDHPYEVEGVLFLLSPTPVYYGLVNEPGGVTYPVEYFSIDNTTGSESATKANMLLTIGTTPFGDELGRARLRAAVSSGSASVYASRGRGDDELDVVDNAYVTVWDFYPLYPKKSRFLDAGAYFYQLKDFGLLPNQGLVPPYPVANGGPWRIGTIDATTKVLSTDWDGSGSFAVARGAHLGTWSADQCSGGTPSASSVYSTYVAANAFDNNGTTQWAANATTGWLEYQLPSAQVIQGYTVQIYTTPTAAPKNWTFQYHNGSTWVTVDTVVNETNWANTEKRRFAFTNAVSATRWRINISANNGHASNVGIAEMEMFTLTSTNAHSWDFVDGTPSSSTAESPTGVTFPPGFRNVRYTVQDTNGKQHTTIIPVAALGHTISTSEMSYTGTTKTASSEYVTNTADKAFDSNDSTAWRTDIGTVAATLTIQFPSAKTLAKYSIRRWSSLGITAVPKDWECLGSNDGLEWTTLDIQRNQSFSDLGEYEIEWPRSFTYYRLNIRDNGGATSTAIAEWNLYPVDAQLDWIRHAQVLDQRISASGQEMTFRIFEDIDLSDYPDNTLVMYYEREFYDGVEGSLAGPDGSEHVKFRGWIDTEPTSIVAGEAGPVRYVDLHCIDVGLRLRQLPAFPQQMERDNNPYKDSSWSYKAWMEMRDLNVDRAAWYVLMWHSTALEVADFQWSGTGDTYARSSIAANGGALYDQVDWLAQAIAHRFTCDKHGRLWMLPDPQLQDSGDRTGVSQASVDDDDIVELRYTTTRPSRYHWLWGSAVQANTQEFDDAGLSETAFQCVAPGAAPGAGVGSFNVGEQFVVDQAELNAREGHRYAVRLNPRETFFTIQVAHAGDVGVDPAAMAWVTVSLSSEAAAQRGLTLTSERFLPYEVTIRHDHEALTKEVTWYVERERVGVPAETES